MVDKKAELKASSMNRLETHDLPTPESPIKSRLNMSSYVSAAIVFPESWSKMSLNELLSQSHDKGWVPIEQQEECSG